MRLQKLLASVTSRRKAEQMILAGRVRINGQIVNSLGVQADFADIVTLDGAVVSMQKKVYIMLHKPKGVVTTAQDQFKRCTVLDYTAEIKERIFPVGRLDYDTSGLILLTNDGDWSNFLMHPSNEIKKTYIAWIRGEPHKKAIRTFRRGIEIDERITAKCEIRIITRDKENDRTKVQIKLHEGRNRQIRKMCDIIGHPVISLMRVAVGDILLGRLPVGNWRHLTDEEVRGVYKQGGL